MSSPNNNRKDNDEYEINIDGKEYKIKPPEMLEVPENEKVHVNININEDGTIDMPECNDSDAGKQMYERVVRIFMEEVEAIPPEHFVAHQRQIGVKEENIEPYEEFVKGLRNDDNDESNNEIRQQLIEEFQNLLETFPLMNIIVAEQGFDTMLRYTSKNLITYATSVNTQLASQGVDFNEDMNEKDVEMRAKTPTPLSPSTSSENKDKNKIESIDDLSRLHQFIAIILQSFYISMNPNFGQELQGAQ